MTDRPNIIIQGKKISLKYKLELEINQMLKKRGRGGCKYATFCSQT